MFLFMFCFFKQKTAYEMRISDWSSDVCSSDLEGAGGRGCAGRRERHAGAAHRGLLRLGRDRAAVRPGQCVLPARRQDGGLHGPGAGGAGRRRDGDRDGPRRSEEHTSELQSLMRISYAVFCLKKNNTIRLNNMT